jgi:hypothetical protein
LAVLVLGEDPFLARSLFQEIAERSPVGTAFPEVGGQTARVECEQGHDRDCAESESPAGTHTSERKSDEDGSRNTGWQESPSDVPVRVKMPEDLDGYNASQTPEEEEP